MSGFLYFIETNAKSITNEILTEHGLSCFHDRLSEFRECNCPLGKGIVFSVIGKNYNLNVGYYHDKQVWETFEHNDELSFSVGYEFKPRPEDLIKQDYIDGHSVKLGDDEEWIIPLAKKLPVGENVLPKKIKEIRQGKVVEVPIERYFELSRLADNVWDDFANQKNIFSWDSNIDLVYKECRGLISYNYDLEWFEISLLGLITRDNSLAILWSLVDYYSVNSFFDDEKKKENLETEQYIT